MALNFADISPDTYTAEYNARRAGYRFVDTGDGNGYWVNQDGERAKINTEDGAQSVPNALWQDLGSLGYAQDSGDPNYIAKNAQYGAGQNFGGDYQKYLDYRFGLGSSVVDDPRFSDALNGGRLIKAGDPSKALSPTAVALPNTSNGWFKDFALPAIATAAMVYGAGTLASGAMGAGAGATTAGGPPSSYWNMLADAGGAASDAAPAAAGAIGDSSLAGVSNLGIDPALMNATSEFGGSLATGAAPATANALTAGGTLAGPALAGAAGAGGGAAGTMALSDLAKYGLIGSAVQGVGGALASKSAADTAAGAANRATDATLGMFNTVNQQQAPYRQAGYSALSDIASLKPYLTHQFDANDLHTNLAPNYEFMRDQGLRAVTNQLNKGGGLYGGNTLKGINDYAMNYADNAYQSAFSNYQSQRDSIFNRLASIAGLGQTATANTGNVGANLAGTAAGSTIAGGQAQAAGTIGAANSLSNAGNSAMGWYALPQLLNYGRVQ